FLAACATVPNPIALETRNSFYVKDADVVWKVEDADRLDKPEYVEGKEDLVARLKPAVEAAFKTSPSGADAVTFRIEIKEYTRVGAAMGNLIGGSNTVTADVYIVRISDGAEIGVYENVYGMYASNGGIIGAVVQAASKPDIVGIMANSFAQNLRSKFDSK